MIYFDYIEKPIFRNIVNDLKLNKLFTKENITYYQLGENLVYFKNYKIIVKNEIIPKLLNEKGTIYYKYDQHLINFFLNKNIKLKIFKKNFEKIEKCQIINCNNNSINKFCSKHIIISSLKEYLYYKLINDINVDFPYNIYI